MNTWNIEGLDIKVQAASSYCTISISNDNLKSCAAAFISVFVRSHFISYDSFHLYCNVLVGYSIDPCSIQFGLSQTDKNSVWKITIVICTPVAGRTLTSQRGWANDANKGNAGFRMNRYSAGFYTFISLDSWANR